MTYIAKNNKLYYNGSEIYEAPTDITEIFNDIVNDRAFIIYRGRNLLPDDYHDITNPKINDPKLQEAINQNVLCIDKKGNVIWRIESTLDYPEDHVRFVDNRHGVKQLWVYRRDAREFMVDPENGKILAQRMGL